MKSRAEFTQSHGHELIQATIELKGDHVSLRLWNSHLSIHLPMKTDWEFLFTIEPPWIYMGPGEAERKKWVPSYFYSRLGLTTCVRLLRGHKMRSLQGVMDEFAAAFQFFEGFGENWDALDECLCYMDEWLPASAYVVIIERAEELLAQDDAEQLRIMLSLLNRVGEWWAAPVTDNGRFNRPPIPFHVLLFFSDGYDSGACIRKAAHELGLKIRG